MWTSVFGEGMKAIPTYGVFRMGENKGGRNENGSENNFTCLDVG